MTSADIIPPAAAAVSADGAAPRSIRPVYNGSRKDLFFIALGRMILTIVTLGIGRFWMITRLRRYYWSSIEIDGAPLEYTGRAIEKLLGFLIAIVALAAYLLVVNLALTFIGLSVFDGNPLALQLPLLALLPLIYWAVYRAYRYLLARTRWRGIRFGLLPGAWGYTWRAMLWSFLSVLTLGLLYPVAQMKLSRYVTNRSFYGDLRFEQRGAIWPLMKSWLMFWAPLVVLIVGQMALVYWTVTQRVSRLDPNTIPSPDASGPANPFAAIAGGMGGIALLLIFIFWSIFAYLHHQVFSFRHIYGGKVLGGRTFATITVSVWTIIGVYLVGWIVIGVVLGITAAIFTALGFGVLAGAGLDFQMLEAMANGQMMFDPSALIGIALLALIYLPVVAMASAMSHAFISHPLLAATISTVDIHDIDGVGRARQREHDEAAEAGGFADALGADIGGGL
ncbi:MAG: DUF898 family protein [Pikeienuella sp.]